jgi:hypothetical protein
MSAVIGFARTTARQITLPDVHAVFRRWLGNDYDLQALDAVLAAAISERLTGDPVWLLVISGAGNAKTETVSALRGAGATVISTITSDGALLSASTAPSAEASTGGLLRAIGTRGILVLKDFTSIISSDHHVRSSVLAALREVYDGAWIRNVGAGGGRTLAWSGRLILIGAVTTAYDAAHSVIATMGDRFVLVRIDSALGRRASGMQAIRNVGSETQMRRELADAVGRLLAGAKLEVALDESEICRLMALADIVTWSRTAVGSGGAHALEAPTRYAKQLAQVVRGGVAIGMSREDAMRLAVRCARDSIPPQRLDILLDIAAHPATNPSDVARRFAKPWTSIKREIDALVMLRLLKCKESIRRERKTNGRFSRKTTTTRRYDLGDDFDRPTLLLMVAEPASPKK